MLWNVQAMNKIVIFAVIIVLAIGAFFVFGNSNNSESNTNFHYAERAVIFKSMSCGCCSVYASYLQKRGVEADVPEISDTELASMKDKYQIPANMRSCHTTQYGNYFVEGHIPLEAVQKMLTEKPDILGIAMPGMPMGSPGMPGSKDEQFVIYAINKDGSSYEFMRI